MLRALEPEDADFLYISESDAEAWRYSDYVAPLSREQLRHYALTYDADPYAAGQLRLIYECDGQPAGIVDVFDISARHLRAEVGIFLIPECRGKGLGRKALADLDYYCSHRLGLHQLTAVVSVSNFTALNCFKNDGYVEIANLPDWIRTKAGFSAAVLLQKVL